MGRYAILHVNKLKSTSDMKHAANHNFRKLIADNVDRDRVKDNIQLKGDANASYVKLFNETIKKSSYYKNHDVRKNGVLGFEVLMTVSREMKDNVSLEEWSKANIEWLEKEFGKDNVKNAVLHLDEETPHIHAFVIPMVENEKLNAFHYINGKKGLSLLQDRYAEEMNRFGLERGIKYTRAKHEDIKEFYRKIDDALAYSDKLKEYAVQRDDETEEECIERLISEMSDLAIRNKKLEEEHEEDERKLLALSKKIDEVNRRNDETNELINLAAGNDIGDMVNTVLKHSKNEKMLEILTKVMTWVSSEYEDCKEMMILNGLDEDV